MLQFARIIDAGMEPLAATIVTAAGIVLFVAVVL